MTLSIAAFKLIQFTHWLASATEWRNHIRRGIALPKFAAHARDVEQWAKSDLAEWKRLTFEQP